MLNVFTVDVEDYFQVSGFESGIDRSQWSGFESRVVASTQRLLGLLDKHQVRGTFFVLGWVAERFPELVREIHELGHELGSHSYWHRLVYDQTPEQFREDLRRSRDVLEDITGGPIVVYRAPSFSIVNRSRWALEILAEEGFRVDSSVFPGVHDRYGIPGSPVGPYQISTASGSLWEFPPTVARLGKIRIPVGGGGYFRLFPFAWSAYWLNRVKQSEDRPCMFYVHPWEVDPEQPRLKVASRMARFRHYVNQARTFPRLDTLLQKFRFTTLGDAINTIDSAPHSQRAEYEFTTQ